MLSDVQLVRDVAAGTSRLREQSTKYLPQHPAEERANYLARLNIATLFNGVGRTIRGLAGMVFAKDLMLAEDVPDALKAHAEDIDNRGTHLDLFSKDLFEDALEAGHTFILADAPKREADLTLAEEQERGRRPYWLHIRLENVINWQTTTIDGRTFLAGVVTREHVSQRDGLYGEEVQTQFRVFRRIVGEDGVARVQFQLWRIAGGKPELIEDGWFGNITEIPLVPIYANKTGFFTSRPPLLDLARINLRHYQMNADFGWCLHMMNVPVLVLTGVGADGKVEIGPNTVFNIPEGGSVEFVEPTGAAFATPYQSGTLGHFFAR